MRIRCSEMSVILKEGSVILDNQQDRPESIENSGHVRKEGTDRIALMDGLLGISATCTAAPNIRTDVPRCESLCISAPGENNSHMTAAPPLLVAFSSFSDFPRIFEWL